MRYTFADTFPGEMYQEMSSVDISGRKCVRLPARNATEMRSTAFGAHFPEEMRHFGLQAPVSDSFPPPLPEK